MLFFPFCYNSTAPKRKRPRPVKYEEENPLVYTAKNNPISSTIKGDTDQTAKIEASSPNLEKNSGSVAENGRKHQISGQLGLGAIENSYDEKIMNRSWIFEIEILKRA